jgi:hypothetical protein
MDAARAHRGGAFYVRIGRRDAAGCWADGSDVQDHDALGKLKFG